MLLRIVVGYHFYKEGTAKLKSGTFTSKYFLSAAKGPLAPYFKSMLEDADGKELLCIKEEKSDDSTSYSIDAEQTFAIWDDFVDRTFDYYGLGSQELGDKVAQRGVALRQEFDAAVEAGDEKLAQEMREKIELATADQTVIQSQPKQAEDILENHREQLIDFLNYNQVELISHFSTADRLEGFQRDGKNREQVALHVDSLRGQVDTIRADRAKKLREWTAEVTSIWDSFESQINELAVEEQGNEQKRSKLLIHRPHDDANAKSKWIDKIIPWFDTIVGALLILGLFTRFASLAAALFLVSVILTQPPWIPGTEPTYFYFIELFALLVIFATCAGRLGGLDFFFSKPDKNVQRIQPEFEA